MEEEITTNNCMIPMLKVVLTESQDEFLKIYSDAECKDGKCTYVVNNIIFIETDKDYEYLTSTFYPIPNEIN